MTGRSERIEALVRRGEIERGSLGTAVEDLRADLVRRRLQWRIAGILAGGLAAAATSAYKLFGKHSIAAKVGRYSTAASLLLGLTRGVLKLRRFF